MSSMSRNSILFVLIAFLLCSCGAGRHLPTQTEQKDSIVYRDKYVYEAMEVPRELTSWQKWQMRSFWILLVIVAGYVLRKPLLALIRRFYNIP